MVAHLVRLKLLLLGNALRRSIWQVVGLVAATMYAVGILTGLILSLGRLVEKDQEMAVMVVGVGGAVLVLAWWFMPLLAFGIDSTLTAQRLAVYPLTRRQLLVGLSAAGLVGVPGVLTVLVALCSTIVWRGKPAELTVALGCVVLAVATCVVGSRTWAAVAAPIQASRRFRETMAVVVLVPVLAVVPLAAWLSSRDEVEMLTLDSFAAFFAWTPPGAVWAVPAAVSDGDTLVALARLGVAVLTLVLLLTLWSWAMTRAQTSPPRTGHAATTKGLGLLGVVPATAAWSIAARCLVYWARDPRYVSSLLIVPFMPVVFAVADKGGPLVLVAAPVAAFVLGWVISADVAYDHTAFWLHVSSGVTGYADRVGRVVAAMVVAVPATVALAVGGCWYSGRWHDLPAVAGMSLGVLLTALGLASVVSARFVYPVPRPGDGPFSTPQGSAMASMAIQMGGWTVLLLLVLPEVALGVLSISTQQAALGWAALVVGLVGGSALLVAGVRLGGRVFDARAPELLQQVAAIR